MRAVCENHKRKAASSVTDGIESKFCRYVDTAERRVLDLGPDGVPEIPVLGYNKSAKVKGGVERHRHDGIMEITYCIRGSLKFDCNGKTYNVLPGEVFWAGPTDVHRLHSNELGSRLRWIFFRLPKPGESIVGLRSNESDWLVRRMRNLPARVFDGGSRVGTAFEELFIAYDMVKRGTPERTLRIRKGALDLLVALVDTGYRPRQKDSACQLERLVDQMRRNPMGDFDIDALAPGMGMSPVYLVGKFKRLSGLPPHAFLLKCRIHHSATLLEKSGMSIGDIAMSLKFASAQHFATRFKKEMGKTPTEWRMEHRRKEHI